MAGYNAHTRGAQKKAAAKKPKKGVDLKKLMEAGALLAEAGSRGSSGGIASALQKSKIDLSGKDDGGTNPRSGASNGAKNTNSFDEQNTEDAAAKALKKKILNPTAPDPLGEGKTDYYA